MQTEAAAALVAELANVMTTPSSEPPPGNETCEDRAKSGSHPTARVKNQQATTNNDRKPAATKRNNRIARLETVAAAATDVTPCCDNELKNRVAAVAKGRPSPET